MRPGDLLQIMPARRWTSGEGTQLPYEYFNVARYDRLVTHVQVLYGDPSGCNLKFMTGMERRSDSMKEIYALPIVADNTIYAVVLGRDVRQDAEKCLGTWFCVAWEAGQSNDVVAEVTALAHTQEEGMSNGVGGGQQGTSLTLLAAKRFTAAGVGEQQPYDYTYVGAFQRVIVHIFCLYAPGTGTTTINFKTGMYRRQDRMKTILATPISIGTGQSNTIIPVVLGRDGTSGSDLLGEWLCVEWNDATTCVVEIKAMAW